jgi:hypothetical protein
VLFDRCGDPAVTIVPEDAYRSTIRKETFPVLLLSEKDVKHEITEMEQFIERGPEYQVQYLVEIEEQWFLYVATSKTHPDLATAFVTRGPPTGQNARRYIDNVKTERMADGGFAEFFTEDESDEISAITLSLYIPSSLLDDVPELILDGQEERIVMVYGSEDPKFMGLELLSSEEKRGTAQFASRAA